MIIITNTYLIINLLHICNYYELRLLRRCGGKFLSREGAERIGEMFVEAVKSHRGKDAVQRLFLCVFLHRHVTEKGLSFQSSQRTSKYRYLVFKMPWTRLSRRKRNWNCR